MKGTMRFKNNAWRLQVYAGVDENGRERRVQRTVRAPNNRTGRKEAERVLAELVLDVEARRDLRDRDLTVEQLLERFIRTRRDDWSPSTTLNARNAVKLYIRPHIGPTPAYRVRGIDIDLMYRKLLDTGLAPASVRRVHAVLHSAYNQAVKWQIVAHNPVDAATQPKARRSQMRPPAPTELARALAAVDDDPALAAFFRLAASTGARRGTLCAVRWTDLDLDAGTATFSRAIVAGEHGEHHERGTKTDRPYKVAIGPATCAALTRHRRARAEACLAAGEPLPPDAFVFSRDVAGEHHWRPDFVTYRWAKLRDELELGPVRFHDLRHFVATQLLAAGEDVVTVAGRLGHANPNVTLLIYSHFLPERDRHAADVIETIIATKDAG